MLSVRLVPSARHAERPPAPAVGSLGKVTVSGTTANAAVSCTGVNGQSCSLSLTMSVTEHIKGGKVIGVSPATKNKTVVVGKAAKTVAAGGGASVKLALNGTGKKLLKQFHTLNVTLTVNQGTKKIGTKKLTFKSAKKKH